jgi:predicted PhzF superfamily epimerase YddE/YHI9
VDVYLVDAFADRAFTGNQAGVVLLDEPRPDDWMRAVAAELRCSETSFLDLTGGLGDEPIPLRWFTPTTEVKLCGHATLAAAHVLAEDHGRTGSRFRTLSGELVCRVDADGRVGMDFPADPPTPITPDPVLLAALPGVTVRAVAAGAFDLLVEVADTAELRALRPDLAALATLPVRGVIVTAAGDEPGLDVVSRCFYPAVGIPEDPVTGSAHCTLACWWTDRLGRPELTARQGGERGGSLRVTLRGDRVTLLGAAVTVLRGHLLA